MDSKKDHDTGENIKEDICNPITHWVKFPEFIINSITEHSNGLIGIGFFVCEYSFDPLPTQIPNGGILINHTIIPIRKLVSQRIEVKDSDKHRDEKADGEQPEGLSCHPQPKATEMTDSLILKPHGNRNHLPCP